MSLALTCTYEPAEPTCARKHLTTDPMVNTDKLYADVVSPFGASKVLTNAAADEIWQGMAESGFLQIDVG